MAGEQTPLLSDSTTASPLSNLTKFRRAIGINSTSTDVTTPSDLESARKTAHGIYKEIISTQIWRKRQFRLVESLFYIALGTQIVIGATLAALGPSSKIHPTAITILGIVNTSLAGLLALFKGQGLPDRLRKDGFEMRKVQDYIEEMETRLVTMGEGEFDDDELDNVLQTVFAKYNAARDTAELNRPDSYARQGEADIMRGVSDKGGKRSLVPNNNGKGKDIQYEIS